MSAVMPDISTIQTVESKYSKEYIQEVTDKANVIRKKAENNEPLTLEEAKVMVEYMRVSRTTVFELKKAATKQKTEKVDKPKKIVYHPDDVNQPIEPIELTQRQITNYTNKLGKGTITWKELKLLEKAIEEIIMNKEEFETYKEANADKRK